MNQPQKIEFKPDRYSYFPGQTGNGFITFRDIKKVKGITLSLVQLSNRLKKKNLARFEFKIEGKENPQKELEVQFQIPKGITCSFKGTKLKVWHQWEVELDIPWARDQDFSFPMKIKPMPLKGKHIGMFMRTTPLPLKSKGLFKSWTTRIAFIFASIAMFGIPFIAVPLFLGLRKLFFMRIIKKYEIHVARKEWAMGEILPFEVIIEPKKEFLINKIEGRLEATESFWKSRGGKKKYKSYFSFSKELVVIENRKVSVNNGESVSFKEKFSIPMNLPSMARNLVWNLIIKVDIAGFPDIKWAEELDVVPMSVEE